MRFLQGLFLVIAMFSVSRIFALGVGYTSHPIPEKKNLINGELTGITSDNGGVGVQMRYTHKLMKQLSLDAGFGLSGGDRENRIFAGADYELFPDYGYQPRISVKTTFEWANEFEQSTSNWAVAPVVSKGFNAWGNEVFPYVSVPVGLKLVSDIKTYETFVNLSLGATAPVSIEGYKNITANTELTIDIKDSYTAFYIGAGYQF